MDTLNHSGILGQKWGQKNGPPYPLGTKDHQRVTKSAGSAERFAAIERGGGRAASLHTSNAPKKSRFVNSKMDVSAMKIRSASDLKTAKKYIATYMLGKNEVDTYLKANTPFSRIQTSKEMEEFPFYATYKKHDVQMYEGLFGKNLKSRALAAAKASGDAEQIQKAKDMEVYRVQLKNTHNLKVPSDESAGNITAKLLNKGDFKENLKASIDDSRSKMKRPSQQILFNKADKAMEKHPEPGLNPSDKKNLYKALNLTLTNHNDQEVAMQKTFYSEMKKKGYHALVDTNDQEYSSYHAKRPMIVFDVDKTKVDKVHTLDDKRVDKLYKKYNRERLMKESIEQTFGTPMKMLRHSEGGYEMYYAVDDETEDLQHHGILGMKWGVRRFQRKDGTLTPAGRKHVQENSDETQNDTPKHSINGKAVAKVALGAAAAVGAGALAYHYVTMPKEYRALINSCAKVGIKNLGKNAADYTKKKLSTVGDRMVDAALLSMGGIAVANLTKKVNDKFADHEGDSEATKAFNKIARDTLNAGINSAINGNGSSSSSNNSSGGVKAGANAGKEISEKIGPPSKKSIDKQSAEYQNLFKDSNGNQRDAETRSTIKALASQGYDIEQIDKWLNHSEFNIIDKYLGLEIRW